MDDHDPVRAKLPAGDFSQPLALRSIGLITANFRSVVNADDAFLKLLDYSRHDLAAGLPTWERLVPHRDLQVVQTWLRAALTAGEALRAEQRLVRRFGETVLVRMGALWPAGEAAATCYVAQLGTEGETTATLNSAHAHLAARVESSHDAIISLSLDRRVLSWNPSAERQFGYTAAEMIGQDIILIFPDGRYHEKDDLFERLKRHGFFRHETQRKRKDGSVIDVELTIAPIRNNAREMEAISVISRDITSLKAIIRDSETANEIIEDQAIQLDAIVDALRSPLVIFDRQGRPLRANAPARQLFGFQADAPPSCSHEEMSRKVQVRDSDGRPIRTNVLPSRRALAGELVEAEEQWITGADRIQRVFQCSAMPLRNNSGINGAVVIFHDISELKRRASHNLVLLRELSHRSKNLLSVVQSIALRSSRSPGSKQDFVDRLSSRLRELANAQDLLSHSSNVNIAITDLILSQIGHLWEAGSPPISLYGDSLRLLPAAAQNLGIALHELSTNALKYGALSTPGGRVEVRWAVESPAFGPSTFVPSWREFDGPPVKTPTRHGFGRTVTETITARALSGECRLRFDRAGVHWELSAPVHLISATD